MRRVAAPAPRTRTGPQVATPPTQGPALCPRTTGPHPRALPLHNARDTPVAPPSSAREQRRAMRHSPRPQRKPPHAAHGSQSGPARRERVWAARVPANVTSARHMTGGGRGFAGVQICSDTRVCVEHCAGEKEGGTGAPAEGIVVFSRSAACPCTAPKAWPRKTNHLYDFLFGAQTPRAHGMTRFRKSSILRRSGKSLQIGYTTPAVSGSPRWGRGGAQPSGAVLRP